MSFTALVLDLIMVPTPINGVLAVFFLCSCLQVKRINATWVVASVSYDFRVITVCDIETESVRCFVLSFVVKVSVPFVVLFCYPPPAF